VYTYKASLIKVLSGACYKKAQSKKHDLKHRLLMTSRLSVEMEGRST